MPLIPTSIPRIAAALTLGLFAALLAFAPPPAWAEDLPPRHAIAMHGTPALEAGFSHFDYANPDAPKGGEIRYGATGSFDSFNPFIIKGTPASGSGLTYDTLMAQSENEPFTQYGLVAESVVMPEDRSFITFHLREGARFHDGEPITAEDVVWTFNALVETGAPFYRFYYANVETVEALDARTVKFTFKDATNRELPLILGQMAVLPKHYWQDKPFAETTLEPPLGSGPYRIKDFEPGKTVVYERVEDYWAKDLNVNRGRHNFDRVRYEYFRDGNVVVEAFKGGALDFRAENISKIWATGYDMAEVGQGLIKKEELPHHRTAPIQGYIYNLRRDLFDDERVRRALAYAFDFEWSNKNLFYGQYTRTRSYFGNSELEAKGLPEGRELEILNAYKDQLPAEVFAEEYNPPATDGDGRIRSNLREADRLLKEAGWVIDGKTRVHEQTGQRFEFEIMLVNPSFERVTLPFSKNLERLGVTADVRQVDSAQYQKRLETFDFDMITFIWGQSQSPGNEQRNYWGSQAAGMNGSRNLIGIQNPVVDELIEKLISAPDRAELVQRTRALDRVLQWGHYLIPHWYADVDRVIYWNKYSRPETIPLQGADTSTWWYDAEKAAKLEQAGAQ